MGGLFDALSIRFVVFNIAIHSVFCCGCEDGILLLEANRILRAGGYFVWASESVYKSQNELVEQWKGVRPYSLLNC